MKRPVFLVLLLFVLAVASVPLLQAQERLLPKPPSAVGVDLLEVIETRKSFRMFTGEPIPDADLSTILWSALGVTWRRGDKASIHGVDATTGATLGERRSTVFAWEPTITAYVLLPEGAFRYEPERHALFEVSPRDLRASATTQGFRGRAAVIVLAAYGEILDHMPGRQEDRMAWANATAGLVAQNIYLAATALGYGTVLIWYVNRSTLPRDLGLADEDQLLYALPLGSVE
jgi:nitroreductase